MRGVDKLVGLLGFKATDEIGSTLSENFKTIGLRLLAEFFSDLITQLSEECLFEMHVFPVCGRAEDLICRTVHRGRLRRAMLPSRELRIGDKVFSFGRQWSPSNWGRISPEPLGDARGAGGVLEQTLVSTALLLLPPVAITEVAAGSCAKDDATLALMTGMPQEVVLPLGDASTTSSLDTHSALLPFVVTTGAAASISTVVGLDVLSTGVMVAAVEAWAGL